jgi:uncharacterized membrane protein
MTESDTQQDLDNRLAERLLLAMLGVLLLRVGVSFWRVASAVESVIGTVPTVLTTAVAVQCLIFAVVGYDLEQHGRQIAYGVVAIMTTMTILSAALTTSAWMPPVNTDAAAFVRYGLQQFGDGINPMAVSMEPALEDVATDFQTLRTDGSVVTSWSYPAGMVVAFIPQWLIGTVGIGYRLTTITATGLVGTAGVRSLPNRFAIAIPIVMLGVHDMWRATAGGILDALWVFPLLIGVVSWARQDWWLAGLCVGIACGVKQLPWAILPFLLIWVIRTSPDAKAFIRRAGKLNAAGAFGFFVITANATFIWWNPSAWWNSVMTPLGGGGAPLVSEGMGLAVLEQFTAVNVGASVWTTIFALTLSGLLIGYWHFFEYKHVRWTAWILPMGLWVIHSRSLINYFSWSAIIAVVVIVASVSALRGQEVTRPCAE